MTTKGKFYIPVVCRQFLFAPLVIFATAFVAKFPVALAGEVVFYTDVNFTGPVLYNFTIPDMEYIKENYGLWNYEYCLELNETKGEASSLKTSNFIVLMDNRGCDHLLDYSHYNKQVYKLALRPGEYPDLPKFLRDNHFPCRVHSFAPDEDLLERQTTTKRLYNMLSLLDRDGRTIRVQNVCGCVDLPRTAYGSVRRVYTRDFCMKLFSEPGCQGKSVKVPPGTTAASLDLRRVSFDGLVKSLSGCEETPCDISKETSMTTTMRNETGFFEVSIPLSLDLEEEGNEQILLKVPPPVNSSCENGTNFSCVTSCGGLLYSRNGAIQYKLGESLESFERCVWIIKPQTEWSRFNVTQVWRGFRSIPGKLEVIISEYTNADRADWENTQDFDLNTIRVNETTHSVTVSGPIIIITLFSKQLENEASGGFLLEYTTLLQRLDNSLSGYSSDWKMDFGQSLCYPLAAQSDKGKHEVSTFLFLPNNHNKDGLMSGMNKFVVDTEASPGIDECCNTIVLYGFSGYTWNWIGRFKYYRKNSAWRFHKRRAEIADVDMALIMLKSDVALPKDGFCMNSTVQSYKVCVNGEAVAAPSQAAKTKESTSEKPEDAKEDSSFLSSGFWVFLIVFVWIFLVLAIAYRATQS